MLDIAPRIPLSSLRRQVDALKRLWDRVLPALRLKIAVNHIAQLWEIAVAKQQPKPDPIDCVHIISDAGFRPESWNPLHAYLEHTDRYRRIPDPKEIINKLNPPKNLASMVAAIQVF